MEVQETVLTSHSLLIILLICHIIFSVCWTLYCITGAEKQEMNYGGPVVGIHVTFLPASLSSSPS
ncbi:hypothetical protein Ocin01_19055 [Orchesella cincta]|uniref:Uncharacterized protein n=1 Tax=Orchesella cincta TaxID=48709 RepID=A0A1D2M3S3_ORCCI|nr:hypothetical protein Ocin01_19055 [Orchesella cincta]